jgi:hypothetical protein
MHEDELRELGVTDDRGRRLRPASVAVRARKGLQDRARTR